MTTDNDPNIILRLEAHGHRAHNLWAHPHNEAFYLPPLSEATNGGLREIVVSPDDWSRELTPGPRDPGLIKVTEPALQITFSKKPKNPELGYLLGSDPESCDIILGSMDDCISHRMFAISFNQYNEVIMETMSRNATVVTYGGQTGTRRNFTWLFPPGQSNIFVKAAETITFKVIVPIHNTDKAAYEVNCRDFMQLANSASHTMGLLNFSSLPETRLASGAATVHTTVEPPFYLRTKKLGNGGFGVVHKIRSMPDGGTAAMKEFKAKNIWNLEARVLRKLVDTPHENIVKFIDFGLGERPYLVMGLCPGGNLEGQHRIMSFTIQEVGLILRQMLNALVYLHKHLEITHRGIKPANILCDSRAQFRLADFGLTQDLDVLKTCKGTQPYMAPEMFAHRPLITSAVDLWALGMVIAQLLTGNGPPGYKGNEGPRWSEAVVAHFENYKHSFQAIGFDGLKQNNLNYLVGQHMLRLMPGDRKSALECLDRGDYLWSLLDQDSENAANAPIHQDPTGSFSNTPRTTHPTGLSNGGRLTENRGASEENGALEEENGSEEEIGSEEETESDEEETESDEEETESDEEENESEAEAGTSGAQTLNPGQGTVGGPQASTNAPSVTPMIQPPHPATYIPTLAHGQTPDLPSLKSQIYGQYGQGLLAQMRRPRRQRRR